VRTNLALRTVDTVAMLASGLVKTITAIEAGELVKHIALNPLPETDGWTLLPDGTIAIVRAHDYHMDWVAPDGRVTSTPRMQFAWREISQAEKQAIIDSAKATFARAIARLDGPPPPGAPRRPPQQIVALEPDEMPTYYPPVRVVKSDADGNVWVLP